MFFLLRESLQHISALSSMALLSNSISGLVVEYIVAIDVTRVRFPAAAFTMNTFKVINSSDRVRAQSLNEQLHIKNKQFRLMRSRSLGGLC